MDAPKTGLLSYVNKMPMFWWADRAIVKRTPWSIYPSQTPHLQLKKYTKKNSGAVRSNYRTEWITKPPGTGQMKLAITEAVMSNGPISRVRCDQCGSMVTSVTNCHCGCGVAVCGKCGKYYHLDAKRAS